MAELFTNHKAAFFTVLVSSPGIVFVLITLALAIVSFYSSLTELSAARA